MFNTIKRKIKELMQPGIKVNLLKITSKLEKLGSPYGGWIIPTGYINSQSVCYLAGAGEDISFDVALAKRFGCQVYVFDPTPRSKTHFEKVMDAALSGKKMPVNNDDSVLYDLDKSVVQHMRFYDIGIWKETTTIKFYAPQDESHISHSISNLQKTDNYFEATVQRLSAITQQNGHTLLDILKLDIEGAEFEVIDTIIEDKVPIKILCIEFHHSDNAGLEKIRTAIKKLEENGYRVVAKENLDITFVNTKFINH